MSATDTTYAELVKRVEDLENRKEPRLRSGRGNVWGDNFGLADALNVPRVSVYRTTALTLAAGTPTALVFNTSEWNTDSMWSSTAGGLITCRTAGVYAFIASVGFINEAGGYRSLFFRKNAAGSYGNVDDPNPTVVTYSQMVAGWQFSLNAGDFVEAIVTSTAATVGLGVAPSNATDRGNGLQACLISTL